MNNSVRKDNSRFPVFDQWLSELLPSAIGAFQLHMMGVHLLPYLRHVTVLSGLCLTCFVVTKLSAGRKIFLRFLSSRTLIWQDF